jgi:hypothetical protein
VRSVLAAILVFEAIVVGLAVPVATSLGGMSLATAGIVAAVVAVACLATAGLLRHPFGRIVGSVLQFVVFGLGFVVPVMFALGVVFGGLWLWAIVLDRRIGATPGRASPADRPQE